MVRCQTSATLLAIVCTLVLAACGGAVEPDSKVDELDPAVARSLDAMLMTDPDLAGLNEANAALTASRDHSLPALVDSPDAVRDAQDLAIALVGGRDRLIELPEAEALDGEPGESPLVLLDDVVSDMVKPEACLNGVRLSANWAAKLPASLPVYPRGSVTEALGRDGSDCALRAVRFVSPVPSDEIMRLYVTLARKEGFTSTYESNGDVSRLTGRKVGSVMIVEIRPSLLAGREVDLIQAAGPAVSLR